jgi:2-desacetyl-2-hydroxyethyl bacteriochlorophyllide A dehydrogenase
MRAKALICDQHQNFTLEDVVLRDPNADQIAIRTHYTGVSIGTEFALIRNKLSWGPYPLCTGYQGSGVVESVGENVRGIAVGDKVYFRRNESMALADGRPISCVSGAHCSHAVITPDSTHGAAKVPEGAGMDVASMFVMPAVGWFGVDMANPRMGTAVVVHGAGLIGQGVIAACAHRGCVVIAVDINRRQLDIALQMGADHVIDGVRQDVAAEVREIAPDGADTVFECTGLPECVNPAIALCRPYGTFVWQGNYGAAPLSLNFLPPHGRRLKMFFPCDDGLQPCRRAVVKNMAMGTLQWDKVITHRIDDAEAPAMFERINSGIDADIVGVVIRWTD